jgi:hypothetical protein
VKKLKTETIKVANTNISFKFRQLSASKGDEVVSLMIGGNKEIQFEPKEWALFCKAVSGTSPFKAHSKNATALAKVPPEKTKPPKLQELSVLTQEVIRHREKLHEFTQSPSLAVQLCVELAAFLGVPFSASEDDFEALRGAVTLALSGTADAMKLEEIFGKIAHAFGGAGHLDHKALIEALNAYRAITNELMLSDPSSVVERVKELVASRVAWDTAWLWATNNHPPQATPLESLAKLEALIREHSSPSIGGMKGRWYGKTVHFLSERLLALTAPPE